MTDETKKTTPEKEKKSNSVQTPEMSSELNAHVEREQPKTENEQEVPKKTRWVQLRVFPIYVRVLLVILLLVVVAIIGLQIGYGYMGDGDPGDVFKKATWTHIVDIIKGKE